MTIPEIEFQISISETDISTDQLDRLTVSLMRQLRDLGAESVERTSAASPPEGAKGTSVTVGALNVVTTPSFIDRMVGFLQTWSSRGERRAVKIKTPSGFKLEFPLEKPLSAQEMVTFVRAITTGAPPEAASPSRRPVDTRCRTQLRELLCAHFDESELRTLCFYLAVNYQDLTGNNRSDKIIALIEYVERHNDVGKLLEVGRNLRKDVLWDGICASTGA